MASKLKNFSFEKDEMKVLSAHPDLNLNELLSVLSEQLNNDEWGILATHKCIVIKVDDDLFFLQLTKAYLPKKDVTVVYLRGLCPIIVAGESSYQLQSVDKEALPFRVSGDNTVSRLCALLEE